MKEKVYAEIGFGNGSFFSTEFERGDRERRVPRFIKPKKVKGIYLRIWMGGREIILLTCDGIKIKRKKKRKFKFLFGVEGIN